MPYSVFKITGEVIAFSDFPALTLGRDGLLDLLSRLSHGKRGSTLAPETGTLYIFKIRRFEFTLAYAFPKESCGKLVRPTPWF
jgi:hypothetical protein